MTTSEPMQIVMVGLGRMGANLVHRLVRDGHRCVVFDANPKVVASLQGEGITSSTSLADAVALATPPRVVWLMLPAAITQDVTDQLAALLSAGDTIVDGGNSFYRDDIARSQQLATKGVHHVDCGTSGGVWGLERGYSLMIGGETDVVSRLESIFRSIAPGDDGTAPTPGRPASGDTASQGYLHCGPSGAGHFVKMVHNGVEYGMMAAIAEGLNVLHHANVGKVAGVVDAETAPVRDPEALRYDFDVAAVAEVWRHGTVISSWLMDLAARALTASPDLKEFSGRVSDSGEGRWTVQVAIDASVPVPVISAALWQRYDSRERGLFAAQVLSALRGQFGGHAEGQG
jgi:6-phosphogluconate dehydrogenase